MRPLPINKSRELCALMAAECANSAIDRMARLLEVSTSGFHKHQGRSGSTRWDECKQRRADLKVKISDLYKESNGVYGSPRITAELHDRGDVISEKRSRRSCARSASSVSARAPSRRAICICVRSRRNTRRKFSAGRSPITVVTERVAYHRNHCPLSGVNLNPQ